MIRSVAERARLILAISIAVPSACSKDPGGVNPWDDAGDEGASESGGSSGADGDASAEGTSGGGETSGASASASASASAGEEDSSGGAEDTAAGSICGDGMITGNEECDCGGVACTADGLGDTTCVDVGANMGGGFSGGTLGCNPASCRFDTTLCSVCGDGELGDGEQCEPELPIAENCQDVGMGSAGALACSDSCEYVYTACTDCGIELDFEGAECPGGWTTGRANGMAAVETWACGDPNSYASGPGTGGRTGMWATNLVGPYSANEAGFVASAPIDLTMCGGETVELTLDHWFRFEGGPSNRDGGIVQVSGDGINWTTVVPTGGTLYTEAMLTTTHAPPDGAEGFSGNSPDEATWTTSTFDVTQFAGTADLRVRFVFGSDSSVQTGGWYIDGLSILGSGD
jgi:hypothetical protein